MSDELKPRTRKEQYYEYMATGENAAELKPRSREEQWFEKIAEAGGSGTDIGAIVVTESSNQLVIALQDSEGQTIVQSTPVGVQSAITDGSATVVSIDSSDIITIKAGVVQTNGAIANSSDSDITLAKVAKTGDYDDLNNKPVIPDVSNKMDKNDPAGTGSLSLNRKSNTTVGSYSTTLGDNNEATAYCSTAEGYQNSVKKNYSHIEGINGFVYAEAAHGEGTSLITKNGSYGHAEGKGTIVDGEGAHAEGLGETFTLQYKTSYTFFDWNVTDLKAGDQFRVIGYVNSLDNNIIAEISSVTYDSYERKNIVTTSNYLGGLESNKYYTCVKIHEARGAGSHVEGHLNLAEGNYSHAEGNHNVAKYRSQHVFGEYNITDYISGGTSDSKGTYIEIVGNGTDTTPSNARTLDWSGNEVVAGTVQAAGFKTVSGSSSEFLKADGSIDNSQYITSSALDNYVTLDDIPKVPKAIDNYIPVKFVQTNVMDSRINLAINVWTFDGNYYYSNSNGTVQLVYDKKTKTWSNKTWTGATPAWPSYYMTSDAEGNIYYIPNASTVYVLEIGASSWTQVNWNTIPDQAKWMWTLNNETYCRSNTYGKEYKLNKSTHQWDEISGWRYYDINRHNSGYMIIDGRGIWSDGQNTYYNNSSSGSSFYMWNDTNNRWDYYDTQSYSSPWKDTSGNTININCYQDDGTHINNDRCRRYIKHFQGKTYIQVGFATNYVKSDIPFIWIPVTIDYNGTNSSWLDQWSEIEGELYRLSQNQASNPVYQLINTIPAKTSDLLNDSGFITSSDVATVATTGAYNDLSGKPSIPSVADYTEYCTTGNFVDDANNYGSSDCILRFDRYGDMVHLTGRFTSAGMTSGTSYQLVYYYSGWSADFPKHDSSNAINLLAYWDSQPISDTDYKGEIYNFTSTTPVGHIFNDHNNFYVQPLTSITSGSLVYFSLTYKCKGNN